MRVIQTPWAGGEADVGTGAQPRTCCVSSILTLHSIWSGLFIPTFSLPCPLLKLKTEPWPEMPLPCAIVSISLWTYREGSGRKCAKLVHRAFLQDVDLHQGLISVLKMALKLYTWKNSNTDI